MDIRPRVVFAHRDQEPASAAETASGQADAGQAPPSEAAAPATTPAPAAFVGQMAEKRTKADGPPELGLSDRKAQYRIWYEKRAEAAYLSQLELQSILERALRRTRFPLSFSAGYHPM